MSRDKIRPVPPRAGQESVWDYPRPPRIERASRRIRARLAGETLADSTRAVRVLETSHPPVYYLPPEDVRMDLLESGRGQSYCEWKGQAVYFDAVIDGRRHERIAWAYPQPSPRARDLAGYLAFYLPRIDEGLVDDEVARPQPGGFYGGWITDDVVGPFKGEPGTEHW